MIRLRLPAPFFPALLTALPAIALSHGPAAAQAVQQSGISLEATTDYRQRGISWSDSDPALRLDGTLAITDAVTIEGRVATLRGSARHAGSDLELTAGPRFSTYAGGWNLAAGVEGHFFAGRDDIEVGPLPVGGDTLDYVEIDASAAHSLGPAQLVLGASFAPSQDAIGGSNLYFNADLSLGVPGTPFLAYAGGGYTIGDDNGDPRAARLRPDGNYADWYLGVERSRGPLALGLVYTDTSISSRDIAPSAYRDSGNGARLSGYLRVSI